MGTEDTYNDFSVIRSRNGKRRSASTPKRTVDPEASPSVEGEVKLEKRQLPKWRYRQLNCVLARQLAPEDRPAPYRKQRTNVWKRLVETELAVLHPGDAVEIQVPTKFPGDKFRQRVVMAIQKHLKPISPWRFRAYLSDRNSVVVECLS